MKFRYGDNIEVIKGFYKGQKGKIVDVWFFGYSYMVELSSMTYKFILARYLKLDYSKR